MVKRAPTQKQTQIVNVRIGDLGKRKGKAKKGKGKSKKGAVIHIPPFNPTPIINFPPGFNSAQPNLFASVPPPPPQRQYAVRPESETAPLTGLNATVPVPLVIEGNPLKTKDKEPKLEAQPTPDITGEFATPTVPFGGTEVPTETKEEEVVFPEYPEPLTSGLSEQTTQSQAQFELGRGPLPSSYVTKYGPLPPISKTATPLSGYVSPIGATFFPTEASVDFPPEDIYSASGTVPKPVKLNADGTPRRKRGPNKPKAIGVESISTVGTAINPLGAPLSSESYVFGVPFAPGQTSTILSGGKYLGAVKPPPEGTSTFSFLGAEVPSEKKSELERQRDTSFSGKSGMGSGLSGTDVSFYA